MDFATAAFRQADPDFQDIVGMASKVAVYNLQQDTSVSPPKPKWHSLNVDGPLYVIRRRSEPYLRMVVKCKKLPNDFVEDVNHTFKLELQRPYLLYQNKQGEVLGMWFEKDDECTAANRLLEDLIRQLQQAAAAAPAPAPAPIPAPAPAPAPQHPRKDTDQDMSKVLQMLQLGGPKAAAPSPSPAPAPQPPQAPGMDRILSMLQGAGVGGAAPPAPQQQPVASAPPPAAAPRPFGAPPPGPFGQPAPPPPPPPPSFRQVPLAPQDLAPRPAPSPWPPAPAPAPAPAPQPPIRVPVAPSRDQLRAALSRVVQRAEFLDLLAGEIAREVGAEPGQATAF